MRRDPFSLQTSKNFEPEKKALDTTLTAIVVVTGTGAANHTTVLNAPLLGTERYNRIGRRIQLKSAHVHIEFTPAVVLQNATTMFCLVWDLEAGALPALGSLYADVDSAGTATNTVLSHVNLDNSKRYRILRKKMVETRAVQVAPQFEQDLAFWSWDVKLDEITQFSGGNTGTIADIVNGALVLGYWSNAAADTGTFNASCRIRYYD